MLNQFSDCVSALDRISSNLWWSWQAGGDQLWARLSPQIWEECQHSPKALLRQLGDDLTAVLSDQPSLREEILEWDQRLTNALSADQTWHSEVGAPCEGGVVYFCSEFGLHESIATYSGGLGILAGDHVKSASDLGLPFSAVGLLYRNGYVQQRLNAEGGQEAEFLTFNFDDYPAVLAVNESGQPLRVEAPLLDGETCQCQVWEMSVGRVKLYLLDADLEENLPEVRALTAK